MNIPFNIQEEAAIKQLAQMLDISEQAVVIQAIRMYQMWQMGAVKLTWPKVITGKLYESDSPELIVKDDTPETTEQIDIVA